MTSWFTHIFFISATEILEFLKISPEAKLPTPESLDSSVILLHSLLDFTLIPGERRLVRTGIQMDLPSKYQARLLQLDSEIRVTSDFVGREEIWVSLWNSSEQDFSFKQGRPLAKMVIEQRIKVEPMFVTDPKNIPGIKNLYFDKELLYYQFVISKPIDGIVFPGDDNLIFELIPMFF